MKQIFVVGSLNYDFTIQSDRFPNKGETIHGHGFTSNPGGKGANQAVAAARARAHVYMVGCIGEDTFGQIIIDELKRNQVDVSFVSKVDAPTGTAIITLAENDNQIIINQGANHQINNRQIKKAFEKANKDDLLILQFEIPLEQIIYSIELANDIGMKIILNPAPAVYKIDQFINRIDYLIPNETEKNIIFSDKFIEKSFNNHLITTLGDKGIKYEYKDEVLHIPSHKVKVVDTTAAGDTFIGYFVAMISKGCEINKALQISNKAAAKTVTKLGAMQAIPHIEEVIS